MGIHLHSVSERGSEGIVIDIECHISNGLPGIIIVGFANKAVDEAKERLRGAFSGSQLQLPKKRVTINLAPADIPKESTGFDLAIATAILVASNQCSSPKKESVIIGELSLDGTIRPVRGIIGKLLVAKKNGIKTFYIPRGNLRQSLLVPDIEVTPIKNLSDWYRHLTNAEMLPSYKSKDVEISPLLEDGIENDFSDVVGQLQAKRALEIAAAGGHNLLMSGPPGTGKSMLAKALASILPPMNRDEMLEVTHLHSLATKKYDRIVRGRPFRAPHHSASDTAIIGGDTYPKPGEISLAHRGVLFFDELPEFKRSALEALRQPLEDKVISVSRAKDSVDFPANFILVATANPCPCGYFGTSKACSCLPHAIMRYQQKLSGPILDRIDLHTNVEEVLHEKLLAKVSTASEPSSAIAKRVHGARILQQKRFGPGKTNSDMSNRDLKNLAMLSIEAKNLLDKASKQLEVSARSYMRIVKVARTIADLEASDNITSQHISEALQYRPQIKQPL